MFFSIFLSRFFPCNTTIESYEHLDYAGFVHYKIHKSIKESAKDNILGRKKKKDGGIMELTIMQIPDIEVEGVESLFKSR